MNIPNKTVSINSPGFSLTADVSYETFLKIIAIITESLTEGLVDPVTAAINKIRHTYESGEVFKLVHPNASGFIWAIKSVREIGNMGLKDAKDLVETWKRPVDNRQSYLQLED
jgi:ribosomal protein L7/L12